MEWEDGTIGEVASNIIVQKLKSWFQNLSEEEKNCYYTGINGLTQSLLEKIEIDIQSEVQAKTWNLGGSTVVCAIVGKDDTLVANIGDSRAYIAKDGKILQISREDTKARKNLEQGKTPNRNLERFDEDSNIITQCIGMDRGDLKHPFVQVLNNKDYDMLLLFSDGVTDCLSDEDIAVVCRTSNKEELSIKIVEKAIRNDSFLPDEYIDYIHLKQYRSGGKDNTTAAVYIAKEDR